MNRVVMRRLSRAAVFLTTLMFMVPGVSLSAPANGDFESAHIITAMPFHDEIDMEGIVARADQPEGSCGAPGPSVWYRFDTTDEGTVTARVGQADFDTTITVYRGSSSEDLRELACNDDAPGTQTASEVTVAVAADERLFVQVSGKTTATGLVVFDLTPGGSAPSPIPHENDSFERAVAIQTLPVEYGLDLTNDTPDEGRPVPDPDACRFTGDRTTWFAYRPSEAEDVVLTMRGNRHPSTFVALYDGSSFDSLRRLGCAWSVVGSTSFVFHLSAGVTYYVEAGSDAAVAGDSSMIGFQFARAPEMDAAITGFSIETAALASSGDYEIPSGFILAIHIEVTNLFPVASGPNVDYVLWGCPKTAGSCSYIEHSFLALGPNETWRHDVEWIGLRGAGDYDFHVRLRIRSAIDVDASNNIASTNHHLGAAGTGAGVGAQNTCVFVLENNCEM